MTRTRIGDVAEQLLDYVEHTKTFRTPRMRAVAMAALFFFSNLVGTGFGPQLVGIGSDLLHAGLGEASLRYALLASLPILLWAAAHFLWVSTYLKADLARADEAAYAAASSNG